MTEHDHHHDHEDHAHPHPHGPLESIGHVRGGAPALDIGGDIGALVVLMDESEAGTELHLRAEGQRGSTIHTGVWARDQGGREVTAALFCALQEGTYWVLEAGGDDVMAVAITGGELMNVDLRTARTAVIATSSSPHR